MVLRRRLGETISVVAEVAVEVVVVAEAGEGQERSVAQTMR